MLKNLRQVTVVEEICFQNQRSPIHHWVTNNIQNTKYTKIPFSKTIKHLLTIVYVMMFHWNIMNYDNNDFIAGITSKTNKINDNHHINYFIIYYLLFYMLSSDHMIALGTRRSISIPKSMSWYLQFMKSFHKIRLL